MKLTWIDSRKWLRDPLVVALVLSLCFHFLTYSVYRTGRVFGWWETSPAFVQNLLARLNAAMVDSEQIEEALKRQQERAEQEVSLVFVDVTPDQASTDAPDDPKFYGAVNSQAANPDSERVDEEVPEIDGEQERMVRTQDVAANSVQEPVSPTPPAEEASEQSQETLNPDVLRPETETTPEPLGQDRTAELAEVDANTPGSPNQLEIPQPLTPKPGDMALREVRPHPEEGDGIPLEGSPDGEEPVRTRPRTLAEARRLQPQESQIAGEKMKQEGGVKRRSIVPSMDTIGTPFGVYDSWLIAQVQQRWYFLLEEADYAYNYAGRVKVSFRLYYDGRVTDFEIIENNSGEIQGMLCQKAIMENVPYRQWPTDLRRIVEKDYRELRFTFYYN